jgi:hypothetical protein
VLDKGHIDHGSPLYLATQWKARQNQQCFYLTSKESK